MSRRKVLFGYLIQAGEYLEHAAEAMTVRRAFDLYLDGLSYTVIAETFNREQIPYCESAPRWDKHTVKRLLENVKYTGADGFPPIVDSEKFQAVQVLIASKTENRKPRADELKPLLKYLCCKCCRAPLTRTGGNAEHVYLKCKRCGISSKPFRKTMTEQILMQWNAHQNPEQMVYHISGELVRINNALNRALEKPTAPEDAIALVFQGISERYRCCVTPPKQMVMSMKDIDWKQFHQEVSSIEVDADGVITINFNGNI